MNFPRFSNLFTPFLSLWCYPCDMFCPLIDADTGPCSSADIHIQRGSQTKLCKALVRHTPFHQHCPKVPTLNIAIKYNIVLFCHDNQMKWQHGHTPSSDSVVREMLNTIYNPSITYIPVQSRPCCLGPPSTCSSLIMWRTVLQYLQTTSKCVHHCATWWTHAGHCHQQNCHMVYRSSQHFLLWKIVSVFDNTYWCHSPNSWGVCTCAPLIHMLEISSKTPFKLRKY